MQTVRENRRNRARRCRVGESRRVLTKQMLHQPAVKAESDHESRGGAGVDLRSNPPETLLFANVGRELREEMTRTLAFSTERFGVLGGQNRIGGEHARDGREQREDGKHRCDERIEALFEIALSGTFGQGLDGRLELTSEPFPKDRHDQLFTALEVPVDRALRDAARARDVLRRHRGEPTFAHQTFGRTDQAFASRGRL